MRVELIEYTHRAQELVALAAKLCYSDKSNKDLMEGMSEESVSGFVDWLSEVGHESPVEHASFTFGVEGISRACMAQITRHRIASFNVQSQRYVPASGFEFVTPPAIAEDEQAQQEFLRAMEVAQECYDKIVHVLLQARKGSLLKSGQNEQQAAAMAQKAAIEDARYVLPNACITKLLVTMNARELKHFFSLRCCNRAQWEIREVAFRMLKLAKGAAPELFKNAGPRCVREACHEGKMSCGKALQVKEIYAALQ
ncbi:MAG: FAD-dependent thymidylate synthase [Oscillospiraceae bacterium]|nr:FAD-dependent thymidylate synthase [Oscillospiraceae bacterium]